MKLYSIRLFQTGFFHLVICILGPPMSFCGLIVHFFLLLIIFHYMVVPQFVYPFTYWRISHLLSVFDNYEYRFYKHSHTGFCVAIPFQISRVLSQLLDFMVEIYLDFKVTAKVYPKVAIPLCFPTSNEWEFLLLHILSTIILYLVYPF